MGLNGHHPSGLPLVTECGDSVGRWLFALPDAIPVAAILAYAYQARKTGTRTRLQYSIPDEAQVGSIQSSSACEEILQCAPGKPPEPGLGATGADIESLIQSITYEVEGEDEYPDDEARRPDQPGC
jgi:hypothetical protein